MSKFKSNHHNYCPIGWCQFARWFAFNIPTGFENFFLGREEIGNQIIGGPGAGAGAMGALFTGGGVISVSSGDVLPFIATSECWCYWL